MPPTSSIRIKPLSGLVTAISQLFQAPQTDIRGVETSSYFGPLQPVKPIAPAGTEPRGFQFHPGQNLIYTPRSEEELTAEELRTWSLYPLARVIIENVKDQICRMPLNVRLKRLPGESAKDYAKRKPDSAKLAAIWSLIEHPNSDQHRQEFQRQLLEDMLVIDAASILFRTTKSLDVVELRAIDGATITRYIDENGYTPAPPSPAYAQLWYGIPMVDLTTDQLLYAARNIRLGKLYGFSPTEQAYEWIKLGADRLHFQQSYYSEGSVPDAVQIVPLGIPSDKIQEAQAWMNSEIAGNFAKRQQYRYAQGFTEDGTDQVLFPKEKLLVDQFDEFHIRVMCFCYGTSPQRLMRMMNRASAEQADDASEKEGLMPWLDWLQLVYNKILAKVGMCDYEATFEEDVEVDPLKQAQIDDLDIKNGKRTRNETREASGLEPSEVAEADMLMITTASGAVPLEAAKEIERMKAKAEAMPAPEPFGGGPSGPPSNNKEKAMLGAIGELHKAAGRVLRDVK